MVRIAAEGIRQHSITFLFCESGLNHPSRCATWRGALSALAVRGKGKRVLNEIYSRVPFSISVHKNVI
jgi:hypothetical protein